MEIKSKLFFTSCSKVIFILSMGMCSVFSNSQNSSAVVSFKASGPSGSVGGGSGPQSSILKLWIKGPKSGGGVDILPGSSGSGIGGGSGPQSNSLRLWVKGSSSGGGVSILPGSSGDGIGGGSGPQSSILKLWIKGPNSGGGINIIPN